MDRSNYSRIIREIKTTLKDHGLESKVDYQRPLSNGLRGLFMITIKNGLDYCISEVIDLLRGVMKNEGLDVGDKEADEDITLLAKEDRKK